MICMNHPTDERWHALERRNAQEKLIYERHKYLQVLLTPSMTGAYDGGQGFSEVEMLNKVAQKRTGWTLDEAPHQRL